MRLAATLFVLALGAMSLAPAPASAANEPADPPGGRQLAMSFSSGTKSYLLGGFNGSHALTDVWEFDPALNRWTQLAVTLPEGQYGSAVAWDGSSAYIFGGNTNSGVTNRILKFTPSSRQLIEMPTVMPERLFGAGAVWLQGAAYIVGGVRQDGCCITYYYGSIYRYDPNTGEFIQGGRTPFASVHTVVLADGSSVVVAGGMQWPHYGAPAPAPSRAVHRYEISTKRWTECGQLPVPRVAAALLTDGSTRYIVGGWTGSYDAMTILKMNGCASTSVPVTLPQGLAGASAVRTGTTYSVVGGATGETYPFHHLAGKKSSGTVVDGDVNFDLLPGQPRLDGWSDGARVVLHWESLANPFFGTTGYDIYRGTSAENLKIFAATPADQHQWSDELPNVREGDLQETTFFYSVKARSAAGASDPGVVRCDVVQNISTRCSGTGGRQISLCVDEVRSLRTCT